MNSIVYSKHPLFCVDLEVSTTLPWEVPIDGQGVVIELYPVTDNRVNTTGGELLVYWFEGVSRELRC